MGGCKFKVLLVSRLMFVTLVLRMLRQESSLKCKKGLTYIVNSRETGGTERNPVSENKQDAVRYPSGNENKEIAGPKGRSWG